MVALPLMIGHCEKMSKGIHGSLDGYDGAIEVMVGL